VPSPDGEEGRSYADYFLQGLIDSCKALNVEVEFVRSHPKYRSGWFVPAIEICLEHIPEIKRALETISNRKLEDSWSPIQVNEGGYLKKRPFISIDTKVKTISYLDKDRKEQTTPYDKGQVKLDWRLDWPARWWLLHVHVEPFGREHASAGGSYDTGVQVMKDVYKAEPPIPVPYDSIHMAGDTKKMSASKGTAISAVEGTQVMPAEVIRYFILRAPLNRPLFFDPIEGVVKLMDEYSALSAKKDLNEAEKTLLYISTRGAEPTVSRVPFSHLVASYQAALKNPDKVIDIIARTEYEHVIEDQREIIKHELSFIDEWLKKWAPEDIKFELRESLGQDDFSEDEKKYLQELGEKIANAPEDADGEWFHKAIYDIKESMNLQPQQVFKPLYKVLIGKESGPRAGWFLSILPREWLVKRFRLEE
jgi:lysyl-tRNA synthetase class 1